MTNIGKWNGGSVVTILTPGSVATGAMSSVSSTFTNSSSLHKYADVEVFLNTLSPCTGSFVAIYMWESVDTTNFPAQSDSDLRLTTSQLLCVLPTGEAGSTTQRIVARNVLLPASDFQIKMDNQTGVTTSSVSNTVKFLFYDDNLNG